MNNPLNTLLGKTFEIDRFSTGQQIESLLGSEANKRAGSDFQVWEVKSKRVGSKSQVTLGGKATEDIDYLLECVYEKMENVIFVEYILNKDKTFTINKITILFDMNKDLFFTRLEDGLLIEPHHKSINLRASKNNFLSFYGKKAIEYRA